MEKLEDVPIADEAPADSATSELNDKEMREEEPA